MARSSLLILLLGGLGLAAVAASNKKKTQALPAPGPTTKPKPSGGGGGGGGGGATSPVHHDGDPQVVPTPSAPTCAYFLHFFTTTGSVAQTIPLNAETDEGAVAEALGMRSSLGFKNTDGQWIVTKGCDDGSHAQLQVVQTNHGGTSTN